MSEITYASAGVDTEAGDRAVELMAAAVRASHADTVRGGGGGFAGLMDVSALKDYRRPLLATSTDGVGTKVAIAQALDVHDTIGQDLVAMVVDDLVAVGARPLFMTDYIACGKVVPERIAAIVGGIARACAATGTSLVGGETAEHPGLLGEDEYDVAGAATGVVEADAVLGPDRVRTGDVVVAMGSSGLHANGYSLVRRILDARGWALDRHVPELGRTLGEELLEPTRLYARVCLDAAAELDLHALSHVTGGGLAANLARVLPAGTVADIDRTSWEIAPVFQVISEAGPVPWADLEGTLNLGIGMVAVLPAGDAARLVEISEEAGTPAWHLGEIREAREDDPEDMVTGTKGMRGGAVRLHGEHRLG